MQILKAYILSIIDRYKEAKSNGEGLKFTLFYNHKSWGSGGRLRIYEELVNQNMLTESEEFEFKELVLHSLEADFPDYSLLERGVNNRPYGINGGPSIAVKMFPQHPSSIRHSKWLDALWRELLPIIVKVELFPLAFRGSNLTIHLPFASAVVFFVCPANVTDTFSPSSA